MTDPVTLDSSHVIAALREQLSDAHWQITLLRAQVAALTAPDVAEPAPDAVDPAPATD